MRRLLLRFVIFLVPPVLALAFPAWVLQTSGELEPGEVFLQLRRESRPFLFGPAYSDSMGYLKLKTVQDEAPPVVALGSSRVTIFRQDFFAAQFFNAGSGWYHQFDDLLAYLRRIPAGREPQLLIVGLDQKFFNTRWTSRTADPFEPPPMRMRGRLGWPIVRAYWPDVYKDYFAGKFTIGDLTRRRSDGVRRVGLQAIARNRGYHEDGSYTWDYWESHADDLRQIARDEGAYVYGRGISDETLATLQTFLTECQRRRIYVAGFLPPFSPPVYDALERDRTHYGYMFDLPERLAPLFARFGFSFADFTSPARCDIQRDGFFDGQHAAVAGYRRLWTCWTEADTRLRSFSSPDLAARR